MKKIIFISVVVINSFGSEGKEAQPSMFEKIKDTVSSSISNSYDYLKSKVTSKKYDDSINEIEKTVETDFEKSQKEAISKLEDDKNALKKGERKAQEVIDQLTDKSKAYFEENRDKLNAKWEKLSKKVITLQEKLSSIQSKFNQSSITSNLIDNVDTHLSTIKQIPATRRAKNDITIAKESAAYLRELVIRIYDEFDEELNDLIEEVHKYEAKVENKFNDVENKSRNSIASSREAIKRVSK